MIPRIIPLLLIKNGGLVKSFKFKDFNYIGDPMNAVLIFNEKEVDEICLLDIDVTRSGREPDFKLIEDIGSEAFMPFAYGGGINSFSRAKKIFKLGAEKIILNNILFIDKRIISEIVNHSGSQSVVVSIDIKKNFLGKYKVYSYYKKETTSFDVLPYIKSLLELGAGEVFLNFVDLDGTMSGTDIGFIQNISQEISVPLIVCGGIGNLVHIKQAIDSGASAVAAGSLFVYHGKHKAVLINYPEREQIEKLFL